MTHLGVRDSRMSAILLSHDKNEWSGSRMNLSTQRHGAVAVVTASGELDLDVADRLRDCLRETISAEPERVVLDLTAVTFVDSVILGVLIGARNRLGGDPDRFWLVCQHPAVLKILHLTALDQVLPIRASLAEALRL